jgi:hypothetical protein
MRYQLHRFDFAYKVQFSRSVGARVDFELDFSRVGYNLPGSQRSHTKRVSWIASHRESILFAAIPVLQRAYNAHHNIQL